LETETPVSLTNLLPGITDTCWFWYLSMTKDSLVEETFIFVVFVDETQHKFIVDSRWLEDLYPDSSEMDFDYIFNFHMTALSSEEAYKLLRRTLQNLSSYGTVQFNNSNSQIPQFLIMRSAELEGLKVNVTVFSWLSESVDAEFYGTKRYYTDMITNIPFSITKTINPGVNVIQLPLGNIIDAVVHVQVYPFIDKVYVGSGFWFSFDDSPSGGQSHVSLDLPNCDSTTRFGAEDLILGGCAKMTGDVALNGWVGMGRTLNPNGVPVDISQNQALTFSAKGDGKSYRVLIECDTVKDFDFHQFVFTTDVQPRQYVIPLTSFSQRGFGQTVPFTGKDVKAVIWQTIGDPLDSVRLAADEVGFFNSLLIDNTTILLNTADTVGPYLVTTHISDDVGVQSAFLLYSVDNGITFTEVQMGSLSGGNFKVSIPRQRVGTEVRYYVQAHDADGNIATDPVDVPYTTYRFQINPHPYLFVDDFYDTDPENLLGGYSGLFTSEEGGTIISRYDKESVRLDYNVASSNSWAAYATFFNCIDLTPFNSLSFLIKGAAGNEKVKVAVGDTLDNEPKIVIGEYLPEGITTSWQIVRIPLCAFSSVTDWSCMDRFVVGFENNIESDLGTVYLDNIKFELIPVVPLVLDNFNDMTGENGLGGSLWTTSEGGASIDADYDEEHAHTGTGACYRISYAGITESAWAGWGMELLGLNASDYDTIAFFIRGSQGGELPNIYLSDGIHRGFVDIENYVDLNTSWQRVAIPIEDFAHTGLNTASLLYLEIVFEWQQMAGTIYIDDIAFCPPTQYPLKPLVSVSPSVLNFDHVGVGGNVSLPLGIYNFGTGNLSISGITCTDPAFVTDFSPADSLIGPNEYLQITATFSPVSPVYYYDSLIILNNDRTIIVPLRGDASLTDVNEEQEVNLPSDFGLSQNYPNPFNSCTQVRYELPRKSRVNLSIYNLLGQKIRILVDGEQSAGFKNVTWDGKDETGNQVSSGIYLYLLRTKGFQQSRKMLLLK
jgi:hypothetical protein